MEQLLKRARECAQALEKQDEVLIVSHVDADGLASAAIIGCALDRIEKGYEIKIVKKLDPSVFHEVSSAEAVIFTDLGSGSLDLIDDLGPLCVIADHHQPAGSSDTALHLNPHLFGFNGATDLSGAGATYLIARALGQNAQLSDLAVVGAVGDLQHVREGRLAELTDLSSTKLKNTLLWQSKRICRLLANKHDPFISSSNIVQIPIFPDLQETANKFWDS